MSSLFIKFKFNNTIHAPAEKAIHAFQIRDMLYLSQDLPLRRNNFLFIGRHGSLPYPVENHHIRIIMSIRYFLKHIQPIHIIIAHTPEPFVEKV